MSFRGKDQPRKWSTFLVKTAALLHPDCIGGKSRPATDLINESLKFSASVARWQDSCETHFSVWLILQSQTVLNIHCFFRVVANLNTCYRYDQLVYQIQQCSLTRFMQSRYILLDFSCILHSWTVLNIHMFSSGLRPLWNILTALVGHLLNA